MPLDTLSSLRQSYDRDGFVTGIDLISKTQAASHRARMEAIEAKHGPVHYLTKMHTIMTSAWELASHPKALDIVEALIGPDILLFNATYIVKEAGAFSHVSWHQDLTYWGLENDEQVSMWLALSPATEESGCMRMLPGSHKVGRLHHETTDDSSNVLLQGQTVRGVAEEEAVLCPLQPGQASFHHGWTLHASLPNKSNDRRIGLNVQYLSTRNRQTKHDLDSAILVRGEDRYQHFHKDTPAYGDFEPEALRRHEELQRRYVETAGRD